MTWRKRTTIFSFLAATALVFVAGCGVKGDPLPPEQPAELGRGRLTYRRATEGLKIEKPKDQKKDDQQE